MRAELPALLIAVLAIGCRKTEVEPAPIELDPARGELAILAVVGADGTIRSGAVTALEDATFRLARSEEGDALYTWVVAPGTDFIGAGGGAPSEEMMRGLRIRIDGKLEPRDGDGSEAGIAAGTPSGDCGRCPAPSRGGPELALPGWTCPLGQLGRARAFPKEQPALSLAQAAEKILVEWPGTCTCTVDQYPSRASERRVELVYPEPDGWPIEAAACAPDGTTAVFGSTYARLYRDAQHITDREWSFDALLIGAAALDDGSFAVVRRARSFPDMAPSILRYGPDLEPQGEVPGPSIDASQARRIAGDPRLMLFGADMGIAGGAMVTACGQRAPGDAFTCTPLLPGDLRTARDRRITDLVELSGGVFVAGADRGALIFGVVEPPGTDCATRCTRDGERVIRWTPFFDPVLESGILRDGASFDGVGALAAMGSRLFICGNDRLDGNASLVGGFILTATVTAGAVRDAAIAGTPPALHFRAVEGPRLDSTCFAMIELSGVQPGGGVAALFSNGAGVLIDAAERVTYPPSFGALFGVPDRVATVARPVPGCILAQSVDGRLARSLAPDFAVHERIYGPPRDVEGPWSKVAAADGEDFWIFRDAAQALVLREAQRTAKRFEAHPVEGLQGAVTYSAVRETAGLGLILAGAESGNPGAAPFFVRTGALSLPDGMELSTTPIPMDQFHPGEYVRALTETWPGEQAGITTDARVFRLRGTELSFLDVDWSDPQAPEQTATPPRLEDCDKGSLNAPQPTSPSDILRAIDGRDGIAWASGCDGTILRIDRAGAQRVSLYRWPGFAEAKHGFRDNVSPSFTAVRALCADRAVVVSRGPTDLLARGGWAFEIRPQAGAGDGALEVLPYPANDMPALGSTYPGAPVALLGEAGDLAVISGNFNFTSFYPFTAMRRRELPVSINGAARSASGMIFLAGQSERYFLIWPEGQ